MHIFAGHSAAVRAVPATLIISAAYLCAPDSARAAGTLAGTSIVNVATATYTDEADNLQSINSNSVTIRVEEVLDVVISPVGVQPLPIVPGDPEYRLTYRVTNSGNGPEAFSLLANTSLGGDQFDPSLARIVIDRDGDGIYDPFVDTIFAPGSEPVLSPDSSVNVFVFVGLPSGIDNGDEGFASLTASALSGSGSPGTLFPGVGNGGSDAVIGNTTASAALSASLLVAAAQPALVKSQSFSAPGQPTSGTVVTYTISADVSGAGAAAPIVADLIPAGTRYVAGSLTLGGAALSDAADADAGRFSGSAIEVALQANQAGPQVITFQVEVN